MKSSKYLKILKDRYSRLFDIYENYKVGDNYFDLLTSCNIKGVKYMLTKKAKVYTVERNEHCLVNLFNNPVNLERLKDVADKVIDSIDYLVEPHPDHMKTIITGVIIAEYGASEEGENFVMTFRYQKPFMFYLKGWCEVRLVLVDLYQQKLVHNPKDKEVVKLYNIPDDLMNKVDSR
ncbi:hypothetical protein [Natranaerobius thermophilus]|uniref:DUF8052 domain-containing protein n=1 Tax=Natranaerobius thermophilus (strain ATCC BAA-1301 / DSM 18059 / JW/NM-WN-LF) TaxID=457570 RepID=B2A421_NATTJ|nr:hypothetical protein [Natranaerobius thermophilus]ACB85123.1 conserved hypothetical protein [Natranaerobius thermophilus JW/NM-WN-LF]